MSVSRWWLFTAVVLGVSPNIAAELADEPAVGQVDYLTFARGVIPLSVGGDVAVLKTGLEHALSSIDGNAAPFVVTPKPGSKDASVDFVFELPALTTFTAFGVPNVGETPSPSQTFVRSVTIFGSDEGPESGFESLGEQVLQVHSVKGQRTVWPATSQTPVRWIRVRLSGGIDVQREKTFFEFSEIMGFGDQAPVPMSDRFNGKWKGRGVLLELRQEGALVTGCYSRTGDLSGAVTGSVLHASGVDRNDGTASAFVLTVMPDGSINGVRSSNGAPFRIYGGAPGADNLDTGCSEPQAQALGCGSIVYGIQFDFDSADIRPESAQILDELYQGLKRDARMSIVIEGHTSDEGSESYNQDLSLRRASAVVLALTQRGISPNRLAASGKGESEPVASNDGEAGRSLNRRVQVVCSGDGA